MKQLQCSDQFQHAARDMAENPVCEFLKYLYYSCLVSAVKPSLRSSIYVVPRPIYVPICLTYSYILIYRK